MSKSPSNSKIPSSPTKRGVPVSRSVTCSQPSLTYKDVNRILSSCRDNFNGEMKRTRSSPNADNRTLRAKTLNSKVERRSGDQNGLKKVTKSAPNSPIPLNGKIPMSVVRDVLRDCPIENHQKRANAKANSAPVSPSGKLPVKRKTISPQSENNQTPQKKPKTDIKKEVKSKNSPKMMSKKKASPMDEVMKLHQDEGVMHLLHALPTSRRKTQTTLFNSSSFSKQQNHKNNLLTTVNNKNSPNFVTRPPNSKKNHKRNNLVKVNSDNIKSIAPDDLMNPKIMEMLKRLPNNDYLNLWSSTTRYKLTEDSMMLCNNLPLLKQSSVSPDSSTGSDISSASTLARSMMKAKSRKIGERMNLNVANITKQFKDIMVRSYPNFASIIMAPSTTGMKYSFNLNMFDEIIEVLNLLKDNKDCKAIVLTGLNGIFSQGVDLTTLTHDSSEKQRKSAEALAFAIKNFVKFMLNYPKLLVAAVNGANSGLGVMLLPYFDLVYASDKAVMNVDYCKFSQIPEAFGSVSLPPLVLNEMVLLGKGITAEECHSKGLVSNVFWPDRFFEEIVPRLENLEDLSMSGVQMTKNLLKQQLKQKVSSVMDEETKNLIKCWTAPDYGKTMRFYLKTANDILFQ